MKLNTGEAGTEIQWIPTDSLPDWCQAIWDMSRRFTEAGFPGLALTIINLRDSSEPAGDLMGICVNNRVGMSQPQQQSILHAAAQAVKQAGHAVSD